jgi:FkbM family methyltransferase
MQITSCGKFLDIPEIYEGDFADEAPIRDRLWQISPRQVVIDVGASLGTYTLPALACGAAVVAVDVLDEGPLIQMAEANNLSAALTVLSGVAVGSEDRYPEWLMAQARADSATYPGLLECEWVTIDNLVSSRGCALGRVDWIKVDIEGGELAALQGAGETLERWHPRLLIEEHSHLPHVEAAGSAQQLWAYLEGLGYRISTHWHHNRNLWLCEAV